MPALAILIFPVEVLSLVLRPITLSVRLYINMFADHLLLGVSSDLVPILVPAGFVGLGMFVSMVQSFVFTLLTTIYIALSVAHTDHGDAHADDHGHGHDHDHAHAH
jgi:F-type H+-transporting ATPase subunit a